MFDIDRIIAKYRHAPGVLAETGLDPQVLEAIYNDHVKRMPSLETEADRLAAMLRRSPAVHSIKARIKDPEHLIDKILRKKTADSTRDYSLENYRG